ncbi:MAG: DNA recombination protein RmuC [Paludibacteraceae bacterium]|nr:DNA recombination protein RmuC [Paludibacteraceae bacterium]
MFLYILLAVLGGALLGALVVYVVLRQKQYEWQCQAQLAKQEAEYTKQQLQEEQKQALSNKQLWQAETEKRLQDERDIAAKRLQEERVHADNLRREADDQWNKKLEALKNEISRITLEQLAKKQDALQDQNRSQMGELLQPIREKFAEFEKSVNESKTQNAVQKEDLKKSFESMMKLFEQQQNQAVNSLKEQTDKIGNDAANLTKALKGDSKMQGDWGEMVLETILENSGLVRDEHFFVQDNVKDEDGKNFRPDVVVRFPEGRSVVIDSKVSLTAYADAMTADAEEIRTQRMAAHVQSVVKHIDELAAKKYDELVENAIGYVLLFIPNEAAYGAALKARPLLAQDAYKKKIIIISPSNLLMTLQLAYNLWQYDKQTKNVEKIVQSASGLYDKVALFQDSFEKIGSQIQTLSATFESAKGQLSEGKGNVLTRVEKFKELGITPKKQLRITE